MKRALVTGGGGFLGGEIVRQLLERDVEVRSFSRGAYPDLERQGVDHRQGGLDDAEAVRDAVDGCDIVFHIAAKAGIWGSWDTYHRANVLGTKHVIEACRSCGVRRLVFASSPSVVFDGTDQEGIDETVPPPERHLAYYPRSKAMAERMVRDANDADLATVSLRPHLIWGPGDNHLVPRIVSRARAGKLRIVGKGENRIDTVYIADAARAHLLAADRLEPGSPVAGKVYFISADDPIPSKEMIDRILDAAGLPPLDRHISPGVAWTVGLLFEGVYGLFGWEDEPPMTRFLALQLSKAHWYDIGAAKRDLDYEPKVTIDDGMERLARWLKETETEREGEPAS